MIETVHQNPGRFTLTLDPSAPEAIRGLTARAFALIIVTPAPIGSPAKLTTANLLALASYTGVHTSRSRDRSTFSGYGPAWLLTLAKATATATVSSRPLYDGTNTSWIRNNVLRLGSSENNGITVGTITSAASPSKTGKVRAGATPLSILSDVCRRFSREWRVNPAGTLDVASESTLYPTKTTPTAIATPVGGGRDLNITGLPSVGFVEADDWDDYTTTVTVTADSETYTGSDTLGSVPYVDPFSATAVVSRRVVSSPTANTDADCATIASQQLARFDDVNREISLSTDAYSISDDVAAGDYIWCFDPDNDLYDTANEVLYQGRLLRPAKVRARAVSEACDASKGYYALTWNGSAQEIADLTPFVAFEDPSVTIELGEPRRRRPVTPTSI